MRISSLRTYFGKTSGFAAWLCLLAALLSLSHAPASAAEWDLDRLLQSLAKAKAGQATFVEKKYLAMLERPVESSGELVYEAPNRLEKRTLRPQPENMIVDGDTLVIERGKQRHTLQLQEYPELAGSIDGIRGTLAGDRKALERIFGVQLEGSASRWRLLLKPKDAKLARAVHLIRIGGADDDVRSVEVIQTDGDRSVMTINRIANR